MTTVTPKTAQVTTPKATTVQNQSPAINSVASGALASPYDGTIPTALGTSAVPTLTGLGLGTGGLQGAGRQVNATNQTAYAPNGNVNQTVTNENQFTNKYYNIIVPNGIMGGLGGVGMLGGYGYGGYGQGFGSTPMFGNQMGNWNMPGNTFVDPSTGVMYVQKDTGIIGWFKRLFRGW